MSKIKRKNKNNSMSKSSKLVLGGSIASTAALIAIVILTVFVSDLTVKAVGLIFSFIVAIVGVVLNVVGEKKLAKKQTKY